MHIQYLKLNLTTVQQTMTKHLLSVYDMSENKIIGFFNLLILLILKSPRLDVSFVQIVATW